MNNLKISLVFLILMVSTPITVIAEEVNIDENLVGFDHSQQVGLLMGNTHEGGEDGFTVGINYVYRLSEINGLGGLIEYSSGELDSWVIAAPLYIYPYKGLRLLLAIGFEERNSDTEFLFRTGLGYEFEINDKWNIIPEFKYDFVDSDEKYGYGVIFSYEF